MKYLLIILAIFPITIWAELPDYPVMSYTPPTTYTDGTPLDSKKEILLYRLYCNGSEPFLIFPDKTNSWAAKDGEFPPGDYSCYLTSVTASGDESSPSSEMIFTVGQQ